MSAGDFPYWVCNCRHPQTKVYYADAVQNAWLPISSVPRQGVVLLWVRPKTAAEAYTDTNGNPITFQAEPRIVMGKAGQWSGLETADWWMPLPSPPPTGVKP